MKLTINLRYYKKTAFIWIWTCLEARLPARLNWIGNFLLSQTWANFIFQQELHYCLRTVSVFSWYTLAQGFQPTVGRLLLCPAAGGRVRTTGSRRLSIMSQPYLVFFQLCSNMLSRCAFSSLGLKNSSSWVLKLEKIDNFVIFMWKVLISETVRVKTDENFVIICIVNNHNIFCLLKR